MKERVTIPLNVRITPADSERLEAIRKALGVYSTSQAVRCIIRETADMLQEADNEA